MSIATNPRTETIQGSATTLDLLVPNAGLNDMELVEYADLTNGGLNNLNSYEFTHVLENPYQYFVVGMNVGNTTNSWTPNIRLRNDAGTVLTASGDYYGSAEAVGVSGFNSASNSAIFPYNFSGYGLSPNTQQFSFVVEIRDAAKPGIRTTSLNSGMVHASAVVVRSWGAYHLNVIDIHTNILVGTLVGLFNAGEALLYRIREPETP